MQAAGEAVAAEALVQVISQEVARLNAEPERKPMTLAALTVLLGQLGPDQSVPQSLLDAVPSLCADLDSDNGDVKRNACAVLTGLVSLEESVWRSMVQLPLAAKIKDFLASSSAEDNSAAINAIAALMALAQGGPEGCQSVMEHQGASPMLQACSSSSAQVQEAGADGLCQLATQEECRAQLVQQGAVPTLAKLLTKENNEIRVRALMGLGMLLPTSNDSQKQLASDSSTVRTLLALMQQTEDMDCRVIAKDLFTLMARNPDCKQSIEGALRTLSTSGSNTATGNSK